jgi:hypothetical protein
LIALFKNTENVSCVYLLHKYDIVFIHFRKNKKKFEELLIEDTLAQKAFGHNKNSIKNWRDTIKLGNSSNVLVAFAWGP